MTDPATSTVIIAHDEGLVYKTITLKSRQEFLFEREVGILRETMEWSRTPNLVSATFPKIVMTYVGEPITPENAPENFRQQLYRILEGLQVHNLRHNDIRPDNLLVKYGFISLIDFGWAQRRGESFFVPGVLGGEYKAPWGYDDAYSMQKVTEYLEGK